MTVTFEDKALDITLLALLLISMILFGLHMPYVAMTMALIIVLATVATRLSWSVLSAFESIEVD
ncbi:MAG: hypothetical protein AAGF93_03610 [Cyanobacteria bacterium P01_H01_bin.105]